MLAAASRSRPAEASSAISLEATAVAQRRVRRKRRGAIVHGGRVARERLAEVRRCRFSDSFIRTSVRARTIRRSKTFTRESDRLICHAFQAS